MPLDWFSGRIGPSPLLRLKGSTIRKSSYALVLVLALFFLSAGCRQNRPAPTVTPLPPATPIPMAAVPTVEVLPSPTPQQVSGEVPAFSVQDLAAAVDKTKQASTMRFDLRWQVLLNRNGAQNTQDVTGTGKFKGDDRWISFSGRQPTTGTHLVVELTRSAGKAYVKGAAVAPGLDPGSWYEFPATMGNIERITPNPKEILSADNADKLFTSNADPSSIQVLDSQNCQLWIAKNSQLSGIVVNTINQDMAQEFGQVDDLRVQLWLCPDGFVHQVHAVIAGHDPRSATNKGQAEFAVHFYDFDGTDIQVAAPEGARPLPGLAPQPTAKP